MEKKLDQLILCIVGIFSIKNVNAEYVSGSFRKFPNYISENGNIQTKNNDRNLNPNIKSSLKENEPFESKKKSVDSIQINENINLLEESKKSLERAAVIHVFNNNENKETESKNILNESLRTRSSNIKNLNETEILNNTNPESESSSKIKVIELENSISNETMDFDDNIRTIIIDLEDIKNNDNIENISDSNSTSQEKTNNFNDTEVITKNNFRNENLQRKEIWNDEDNEVQNIDSEFEIEKRKIFNIHMLDAKNGKKEKQSISENIDDESIFDNQTIDANENTSLLKENISENVSINSESSDEEKAIKFLINQEMESFNCRDKSNHDVITENYTDNFLKVLSGTTLAGINSENLIKLGKAKLTMHDLYWKSKIVPHYLRGLKKKYWRKHYPLMGYMDLRREFSTSRNFNELQYYWIKWRRITRKPMRESFKTYVEINTNSEKYKNESTSWFSSNQSLSRMQLHRLYREIMPFYRNLHTYVRKRLIRQYGNKKIRSQGPIPEHVLGDISAHEWTNIENILRPYADKKSLEICKNVENRNISAREIAKIAENFYHSLGFDKLDKTFWDNAIFRTMSENCTTEVILKCNNGNYGLDACLDPDCYFFSMIYWTGIAHQLNYAFDINSEISEAVAQLMSLSIATPRHLFSVGLSDIDEYNKYDEINFLMESALRTVPSIMDALSIGLWRDEIMSGVISFEDMNEKFWKHRLYYQGLCPPVPRSEKDFDAGAVKSVANDFNIMKNFLGGILQFQFHKGLCLASSQSFPFHRCNLFNSVEAGDRIRKLLKLGRSVTITDALSIMTDGEKKISALPMIEYFQPLYEWLLIENEFEQVGWKSNDAIICPNCIF